MPARRLVLDSKLHMIFTVTLFAVMGVASLTPAFPGVITHFGIAPQQVGWLIAAFTLPGIGMTPVTGILADRYGRRAVLVPSLVLFAIAGSACFFAGDFFMLIALRFFQGLGASCLGTLNVTMVGDFYENKDRQTAMGYNAGVLSLGTAFYPLIGGLLASAGWQFPFLLPLLAIPAAIWLWLNLPAHRTTPQQISTYILNVWKRINRQEVWLLFSVTFLIFIVLYGSLLTYVPILMKQRMNAGPQEIGMMMALMSLVTATVASQSGRISTRITSTSQMMISLGFYFVAILLYLKSHSLGFLVIPSFLFGMGHGLILPCIQNKLVSHAPLQERAAFMSANSVLTRSGQTLGPLFAGLGYTVAGLTGVLLSGAVVILAMSAIVITLGIKEKREKTGKTE
jgi:MFS transporter, ACDE family, multidrug resistance protein